jgi:hypothetical protein
VLPELFRNATCDAPATFSAYPDEPPVMRQASASRGTGSAHPDNLPSSAAEGWTAGVSGIDCRVDLNH